MCVHKNVVTDDVLSVPDPTLTVGNVATVVENVAVDKRRELWNIFLGDEPAEEIYNGQSSDEEKLHSCADVYVNCTPGSSWESFVQNLFAHSATAAAKAAMEIKPYQKGGS